MPLFLATCAAGAGLAHSAQTPVPKPHPRATAAGNAPLTDGPAIVELSEIYPLLTSTSTNAARAHLAKRAVQASFDASAIKNALDVVFIDARRLDDDEVREQTLALFEAGMPVAVFTPQQMPAAKRGEAARLFGAASEADLAIYAKRGDGGIRVFSTQVGKSLHYPSKAQGMQHFQMAVAEHLAYLTNLARTTARRGATRASGSTNGSPDHVPIIELTDTAVDLDGGQYLTREITVVRDSSPSKDNFNVIVKTSGIIKGGTDYVLKDCKSGVSCTVTSDYAVDVVLEHGNAPRPTMLRALPETTGTAELDYNHTDSTSTHYGFNLGLDAEMSLLGNPSASLKPSFGFNWSKNTTTSTSLAFKVKDYSLAMESRAASSHVQNTWIYSIDPKLYAAVRKGTVTPAMRQLAPQTYSLWTLQAPRSKDFIKIHAWSSVIQRNLDYSLPKLPFKTRVSASGITIDLRSPYLHREPVVILQSKENDGRCLINSGGGRAILGKCSTDIGYQPGQWYLDAYDRYVSRMDGQCLAIDARGEAEVKLAACDAGMTRKWYWAADRITSKYDGGDRGWRLFVAGDRVKVRIDPGRQQAIPNNPNHVLLDPWSTYPGAPVAGATIPTLNGIQPQVPEAWVRAYRDVPSTERWEPVALRQYKEH